MRRRLYIALAALALGGTVTGTIIASSGGSDTDSPAVTCPMKGGDCSMSKQECSQKMRDCSGRAHCPKSGAHGGDLR